MKTNYNDNLEDRKYLINALRWHLDNGADELLLDEAEDRTAMPEMPTKLAAEVAASQGQLKGQLRNKAGSDAQKLNNILGFQDALQQEPQVDMIGAAAAIVEAKKLVVSCQTLEELSAAITAFEGISLKKTASHMVFSDGNPEASVMLIGDAPDANDDVKGSAFAGANGELLDKILGCIGLSRQAEDMDQAVYVSNILNWRPPGNRTPTQAEIDISRPFIERHIALAKPKALILCGGVTAKALLCRSESISKLRAEFHDYRALEGADEPAIPTMVTYHPAYLLKTPAQKRAVWADMLMFKEKLENILT